MNERNPLSLIVNGIFSLIFLAVIASGIYLFASALITGANSLLDTIPTPQEITQTLLVNYCDAMGNNDCVMYANWVNAQTEGKIANCVDMLVSGDFGYTNTGQIMFTPSSQGERQTALLTCLEQYSTTLADYLDTQ